MKKFVNEDTAMGDVMIQDPQISQKILNLQKQINDKLKRIAQTQSEIAVLNQNVNALKNQAVQSQKASQTATKKAEVEVSQNPVNNNVSNENFIMPDFENFLNEDTDKFVPYFKQPDTGDVYMDGKRRYIPWSETSEKHWSDWTDKENERYEKLEKEIETLEYEYQDLQNDLQSARDTHNEAYSWQEDLAGHLQDIHPDAGNTVLSGYGGPNVMAANLAKYGIDKDKAAGFIQSGIQILQMMEDSEKQLEEIPKKMKKVGEKIRNLQLKQNSIGWKSKNTWKKVDERLNEDKTGEEQDGEEVFFVRIPPQEEYEEEVVAKVFQVVDDGRWYMRDILGEADFLDDLVFNTNYDKVEIIEYLTSIFGEVEEIDREDYDDTFDDKEEMDDLFFGDGKKKRKNVRVKLTK